MKTVLASRSISIPEGGTSTVVGLNMGVKFVEEAAISEETFPN